MELKVGSEIHSDDWRAHRFVDSIQLTHTAFAGKRGKRCAQFTACIPRTSRYAEQLAEVWEAVWSALSTGPVSPAQMGALLGALQSRFDYMTIDHAELRGVDVSTSGTLTIEGPKVRIVVRGVSGWSAENLVDTANRPCAIGVKTTPAQVNKVRAWCNANANRIREGMTLAQAETEISALGVRTHSFCAVN